MSIDIPLKKYILKAFDLKEEELKKTLFLQLNIFLLITTLLIVKPTINSLFLSELTSDALPPYSVAVGNPARIIKQYNFETSNWEKIKN